MSGTSLLGLPTSQTHQPNNRFNLFFIDNAELHLDAFQVSIFDPSRNALESGILHLCSRSITFDSNQIQTDLLKLRFNANFSHDNFCGEMLQQQVQTLQSQPPTLGKQTEAILYGQLYELLAQQVMMQSHQADQQQFQNYLQQIHFLVVSVSGYQQMNYHSMPQTVGQSSPGNTEKVCCRIPRDKPGPATTQNAGTFVFLINEDAARQSHLFYTLGQFTRPSPDTGMMLSEEKLIKRYIETRKKEYLEFAKQNEKSQINGAYEVKESVTQITIEGEHICLFLIKRVGDPLKTEMYEIEITPIMNAPHQLNRITIPLNDLKAALTYRYMYERKTLRLVTRSKSEEYLVQFKNIKHKDRVLKTITRLASQYLDKNLQRLETPGLFTESEEPRKVLHEFQLKWQHGMITNAEYLLFLNFAASRSFNDTTQYPVFPWVVADYKNQEFPKEKFVVSSQQPSLGWRDLSKPIGALSNDKLDQFKSKYFQMISKAPNSSPFLKNVGSDAMSQHLQSNEQEFEDDEQNEMAYMYLSHYSTQGIVLYYLIRKYPAFLIRLQNDAFGGPPDRIFHDINNTWQNQMKHLSDNKELIPEFYLGDGSFLINSFDADLGDNHLGQKGGDVGLPDWAQDPQDFVIKMRMALESNTVSMNLQKWIDLVFGHQQQGQKAQMAQNLFQPNTYESFMQMGADDLSPLEKEGYQSQMRFFGQCPVQLFSERDATGNLHYVGHPCKHTRVINTYSQETQNEPKSKADPLKQQFIMSQLEVERLNSLIVDISAQNEQNLQERIEEYKSLKRFHHKKLLRTKKEGEFAFDKLKLKVQELRQKQIANKQQTEAQLAAKDMHYLAIIKSLQEKLKVADANYVPQNYEIYGSSDEKMASVSTLLPVESQKADMKPVQRTGVLLQEADDDPFKIDSGSPINFGKRATLQHVDSLQNPLTSQKHQSDDESPQRPTKTLQQAQSWTRNQPTSKSVYATTQPTIGSPATAQSLNVPGAGLGAQSNGSGQKRMQRVGSSTSTQAWNNQTSRLKALKQKRSQGNMLS